MPIGLLHPALVGERILHTFVDDGAAAEDFDAADFPEIQAAVEPGAGREVVGFSALRIEALAIDARFKYMNGRTCGWRRRRRLTSEDKEHSGVIEKIARAGDRELLRPGDFEPDSLAVAHGADAKPPWLDVDTFIPEAGLLGGDGDGYRAGNVEVDEVVAGGGVSYVDGLVIHSDGKGCGAQLRRNGDGLNPRSGEDDAREREYSRQEDTRSTQEAKILN